MARSTHKVSKKPDREQQRAAFFRLLDAGDSARGAGRQTGIPVTTAIRLAKEHRQAAVDPEHTNGIPAVYQGEPGGILVTPEGIPEEQWRNTIESRLDVIEAFLAVAQQRAHGIPVTPESIPGIPESTPALALTSGPPPPTKKHSFVIALDLLDAINSYAEAHHLEIKAVLDLALWRFFAGEGER